MREKLKKKIILAVWWCQKDRQGAKRQAHCQKQERLMHESTIQKYKTARREKMQERQKRHQGTHTSVYTVGWCVGWSLQGGSERSRGHHSAALTQQKFLQNKGVGADSEKEGKSEEIHSIQNFPGHTWAFSPRNYQQWQHSHKGEP